MTPDPLAERRKPPQTPSSSAPRRTPPTGAPPGHDATRHPTLSPRHNTRNTGAAPPRPRTARSCRSGCRTRAAADPGMALPFARASHSAASARAFGRLVRRTSPRTVVHYADRRMEASAADRMASRLGAAPSDFPDARETRTELAAATSDEVAGGASRPRLEVVASIRLRRQIAERGVVVLPHQPAVEENPRRQNEGRIGRRRAPPPSAGIGPGRRVVVGPDLPRYAFQ